MPEIEYVWDELSDNVIEEYEDGVLTVSYDHEPGLYGNLLSENRNGVTSYYHYDGRGDTVALTDDAGNVTDTKEYDAWGNVVASTGSTVTQYQFSGRQGYQTGIAGVYVRARMYQPTIARWRSVDPIGFADGLNIYQMAHNSPTQAFDPAGLFCVPLITTSTGPTSPVFEDQGSPGVKMSFATEILFAEPCCDCDFRQYVKCTYDMAFIFPNGVVIKGPKPGRAQSTRFSEDCLDMNRDGTIQRWECYGAKRPGVLRPGIGATDEWIGCRYWMKDDPADVYFDGQDLLEKIAEKQNKALPKPLPPGIKVKFCMSCAFKQIVTDTATGVVVWSRTIDAGIPYPTDTPRSVCRTDPLVIRRK